MGFIQECRDRCLQKSITKHQEKLVQVQGHQLPVKEEALQQAQLYVEKFISFLLKDLQAILCPSYDRAKGHGLGTFLPLGDEVWLISLLSSER